MVIGILPSTSQAQTLLNNLYEADFDPKYISVAMIDEKSVQDLGEVKGPLTGAFESVVGNLNKLGLSSEDIKNYQTIVSSGGVFIAVSQSTSTDEAAKEMLQDMSAQNIQIINNK